MKLTTDEKQDKEIFRTIFAENWIISKINTPSTIVVKGFKRVRYYGLQATKSFSKWREIIKEGICKIGKAIKGAYEIVSPKNYQQRYHDITGKDPFVRKYCAGEMILWKIWHPKCGYIFDEEEQIKQDKYGVKEWFEETNGHTVRATARRIQLPLFPLSI